LTSLDEYIARLQALPPDQIAGLVKEADAIIGDVPFVPNPGPQTDAYFSKADILLFGGHPGGGKSALGCGLALNDHYRSLMVRKQLTDAMALFDTAKELCNGHSGYRFAAGGQPKCELPNGGVIHFRGIGKDGAIDTSKQGVQYDLIYVDEAVQNPLSVVRTLLGWNRTARANQRCRMILGTNPPVDSVGDWVADVFGPWLNGAHPQPAKPGELRYFVFDEEDGVIFTENADPIDVNGELKRPLSLSYIPSKLEDNPYLGEDYLRQLDAMPEPFRTILKSGNFLVARKDHDFQCIPTQWVMEAVERWKAHPYPPEGVPMCAIGCDIAQGGDDYTVIVPRYDYWFGKATKKPGYETPTGREVAAHIIINRRDAAEIGLDMGGGYGGGTFEVLRENIEERFINCYKGSESPTQRTRDGKLGFANKRAQAYWKFREALDPSQPGGSPICLPGDNRLIAGLTAPRFEMTTAGIALEIKRRLGSDGKTKGLISRLGFSPDEADAVVIAWATGRHGLVPEKRRQDGRLPFHKPNVNTGYENRRRR
jgi:hypothetical protein